MVVQKSRRHIWPGTAHVEQTAIGLPLKSETSWASVSRPSYGLSMAHRSPLEMRQVPGQKSETSMLPCSSVRVTPSSEGRSVKPASLGAQPSIQPP